MGSARALEDAAAEAVPAEAVPIALPKADADAISVVSSDPSDGGMIDLADPNSTKRIEKRFRREKRRNKSKGGDDEDAAAMKQELNEYCKELYFQEMEEMGMYDFVELEEVQPAPVKVKVPMDKERRKFLKALRKCGEHAPERDNDEWKEILRLQHAANKTSMAGKAVKAGVGATAVVLHNLDGLARATKKGVDRRRDAAVENIKATAAGVGKAAKRVGEEGLVQVVKSSQMARRLHYGLDDDEDSIYDLDDLGQVGEAEALLLDAIGNEDVALEDAEEHATSGPRTAAHREATPAIAPADASEKLQAASQRLAKRRQERRLVQLL